MRLSALRGGVPTRRKAPQIWLCVLAWVVALSVFATCSDCQNLIDNLSSQVSVLRRSNDEIISANNLISTKQQMLLRQIQSGRTEQIQGTNAVSSVWDEMQSTAEQMGQSIGIISANTSAVSQQLTILSNTLSSWSCSCDDSSGGCSCDFSGVISAIDNCRSRVEDIYGYVVDIAGVAGWFETYFGMMYDVQMPDIIGSLHSISNTAFDIDLSLISVTNSLSKLYGSWYTPNPSDSRYYMFYGQTYNDLNKSSWSLGAASSPKVYGYLGAILRELYYTRFEGASLNNYLYYLRNQSFPILTNTVGTLTRASTNFFKTAIAEVRPPHALADWTPLDGSIYDYLTNQYIQARNSSESNWFGRVETLLAALVYQSSDSHEEDLTEVESGLDDVKNQQSELESQMDFEGGIEFLNLDDLSQPALPDLQSRLPEVLSINLGSFGSWLSDGAEYSIDIHPYEIRTLIEIIRGFFRLIWWGVVLGFVYLLWGWFVKLLKWVWSTLKGVDF